MAEKALNITPYRYAFNNPVRIVDPNGSYEEDGHFWTIYLLYTMMGNKNAYDVAYNAEKPDLIINHNGDIVAESDTWLWPWYQRSIHALNGGSATDAVATAEEMLDNANSNEDLGVALHYFGDSFAHRKMTEPDRMYPTGIGHGEINWFAAHGWFKYTDKDVPDNIANRPELYKKYVSDLAD